MPPHAWHVPPCPPNMTQASPALHMPPEQHGCWSPPHIPHVPPKPQPRPVLHVRPVQQTWPEPPHCSQMPPMPHTNPDWVQVPPQHA